MNIIWKVIETGGFILNENCVFCYPNIETDQQIIFSHSSCMFLQLKSAQREGVALNGAGVIVPKQHRETVFDLTSQEWEDTFELLKQVKNWLDTTLQPAGYNIGWNCGSVAGQHIPHAHMHVLPRYEHEEMAGKGIRYLFKNQ